MMLPANFPGRETVNYAWRELARRAGLTNAPGFEENGFESSGIAVRYGVPTEKTLRGPAIFVAPSRRETWEQIVQLSSGRLEQAPLRSLLPPGGRVEFAGPIPVLFRAAGLERSAPFASQPRPGIVVFSVDIVATVLFLLCRWEETVSPSRDEHERMPASASVAFRQGFLDRPLVDQYARILREWIRFLAPDRPLAAPRFEVRLSHDIDVIWPFGRLREMAAAVGKDLIHRRSAVRAARTIAAAARELVAPRSTPYYRGISRLGLLSSRHGLKSAFFFMASNPTPQDRGYDPGSRAVRRCIDELRAGGFELGLHPSYRTLGNFRLLAAEKARFDSILGETRYGGRQHYLRFRAPDTWRDWERAGFTYDSTLSFADHEGFRCGTCHPYRPFDLERNREMDLWEVPLVAMDGTLRQYRGLGPHEAVERILELADRCRQVDGVFTLLWHNSSLEGEWVGWGEAYEKAVGALASFASGGGRPLSSEAATPGSAIRPRASRGTRRKSMAAVKSDAARMGPA
jgi:hypothetical protein